MKKRSILVNWLDLFGQQINLRIFGNEKNKTIFGAITGFLSLILISAVTMYFLVELFQKTTKQIIQNQDMTTMPYNNLTNIPLIVSVKTAYGFLPNDGTIFNIHAIKKTDYWTGGTFYNTTYTSLQIHDCTQAHMGLFNIEDTPIVKQLMCLMPSDQNSLKSFSPDTSNGYSSILFILTKCNPNNNPNCKSNDTINSALEGGFFSFTTYYSVIDNNNITNPSIYIYTSTPTVISNSIYKKISMYLTQNLYQDDDGFVFESFTTYDFFTQGSTITDYSLSYPTSYLPLTNNEIPLSTIQVCNTPYVQRTYRSYQKAQAVLANIGGIIKFIMVVASIITNFVTRKLAIAEIGGAVFNYENVGGSFIKLKNISLSENAIVQETPVDIIRISENNKIEKKKDEFPKISLSPRQFEKPVSNHKKE